MLSTFLVLLILLYSVRILLIWYNMGRHIAPIVIKCAITGQIGIKCAITGQIGIKCAINGQLGIK